MTPEEKRSRQRAQELQTVLDALDSCLLDVDSDVDVDVDQHEDDDDLSQKMELIVEMLLDTNLERMQRKDRLVKALDGMEVVDFTGVIRKDQEQSWSGVRIASDLAEALKITASVHTLELGGFRVGYLGSMLLDSALKKKRHYGDGSIMDVFLSPESAKGHYKAH